MLKVQLIIINMISWNAGLVKQTVFILSSSIFFSFTAIALVHKDNCVHTVYSCVRVFKSFDHGVLSYYMELKEYNLGIGSYQYISE